MFDLKYIRKKTDEFILQSEVTESPSDIRAALNWVLLRNRAERLLDEIGEVVGDVDMVDGDEIRGTVFYDNVAVEVAHRLHECKILVSDRVELLDNDIYFLIAHDGRTRWFDDREQLAVGVILYVRELNFLNQ